MDKRHTAEHLAHFTRHGWVLIENLVPTNEIDAALPGLFELYPTPEAFHADASDARSAAYRADAQSPENAGDEARFRPLQFVGLKEFPFTSKFSIAWRCIRPSSRWPKIYCRRAMSGFIRPRRSRNTPV